LYRNPGVRHAANMHHCIALEAVSLSLTIPTIAPSIT
jgi:hypothetical protein